jgi:hypothetical protein
VRLRALWRAVIALPILAARAEGTYPTAVIGRCHAFIWSMAMPEFWYEGPTDTRDAAADRPFTTHSSMLRLAVLVFALIIAALLIAR